MDFKLVTSTLLKEFNENEIRYAIIGGFAMGLWEVSRSTVDLDFLLLVDDLPRAETILTKYAYRRAFKSENVAQYTSDLAHYGHVDILIAFRKVSKAMLKRSVEKTLDDGSKVFTLLPEDIIGLKLQALVNDPRREDRDIADMNSLISMSRKKAITIDWELLEEHFGLFNREDLLKTLRETNE